MSHNSNFSLRLQQSLSAIIALPDDTTDQSLENKASVVFADEIFILPFRENDISTAWFLIAGN